MEMRGAMVHEGRMEGGVWSVRGAAKKKVRNGRE